MNVLLTLLFIFVSFLSTGFPQPVFAVSGDVTISAFVPGETYATTTFNFSSGGTYTFNSAASGNVCDFTFPADFYSESLDLRANSYSNTFFNTSKPAPSGKSFIGKTYDFDLFTSSNSQVTAVNKAVTIVCRYSDADINGIDESTLTPYRIGSSDSSWQLISGSTVDTVNNKVTFSTTLFSSFGLFGAPPPPPAPSPAPSGGSGGGGGGGGGFLAAPETKVVFSGRAYPGMKVTVLKDAQIAASTIADPAANFSITVSRLSAGGYIFGVYSEDNQGRRSSLLTFPVTVTSGVTVEMGNIFIAPTIAVDKSEVKRGENIAIFGQSAPKADVTIAISFKEEFFGKTIADAGGAYLYNFDTAQLDKGQHLTKSKAAVGGAISSFGKTVSFAVGAKTVFAQPSKCPAKADLNNDYQVNLVDFSIAAYWYKRSLSAEFKSKEAERLSGDGKVDLIDFSIMAFYWTG